EEAVAGMDEPGTAAAGGADDLGRIEVGGRAAARQGDDLVRQLHVQAGGRAQSLLVRGAHRDRLHALRPCGADDPHGDLAPVGDEECARRFHRDGQAPLESVWSTSASTSSVLRILTVAVIGIASTNTNSGTLNTAMFSCAHAVSASASG